MIIIDTSALIDSLVGPRRSAPTMRWLIEEGERLALPFESEQSELASRLYRLAGRSRGGEVDLAIAAHAISGDTPLWSLNTDDFVDIPGLTMVPLSREARDRLLTASGGRSR